ncbi:MAG: SDR family NAD(P)-dependent oxidoreductase, partial [Stenotrophomonas sp.]
MQLSSVRAVITGGVSGLGLSVARYLVAHGAKVALFDLNDDKGAAAVAELGEANARYFTTNVSDEAAVAAQIDPDQRVAGRQRRLLDELVEPRQIAGQAVQQQQRR